LSPTQSLAIAVAAAAAAIIAAIFVAVPRVQETPAPEIAQPDSIVYTAKFECGTISGSEGPLRPGHYDTDIGVFNKQDFKVGLAWSAAVSDGRATSSILRTLEPQSATSIVCDDLRKLVGDEKFVEGFVYINVPIDQSIIGDSSEVVVGRQQGNVDILDVQVFYTANALEGLPREVLVDKIVFTITGDASGKVPAEMLGRTLDVTVRSSLDEISDPEEKVKNVMAERFGLSAQEAGSLQIEIESISVGTGAMIDDHALSLSRVPAQVRG
jgi:hypothetical protein